MYQLIIYLFASLFSILYYAISLSFSFLCSPPHQTSKNVLFILQRLEAGLNSQEKELFSIANLAENKEKNRFLNILPCEYYKANF